MVESLAQSTVELKTECGKYTCHTPSSTVDSNEKSTSSKVSSPQETRKLAMYRLPHSEQQWLEVKRLYESLRVHRNRKLSSILATRPSNSVARSEASILASLSVSCRLETRCVASKVSVHTRLENLQVWLPHVRATVARSEKRPLQVFESRVDSNFREVDYLVSSPQLNSKCGKYTCHTPSSTVDSRLSMKSLLVQLHETRDLQWSLLVQSTVELENTSILATLRVQQWLNEKRPLQVSSLV